MAPNYDLLAVRRGTVTAPAGCGKTQLIADTLGRYIERKPILILTHTNAGVNALRIRLHRANVRQSAYRVMTIDGFAMRLVGSFPLRSGLPNHVLALSNPRNDYPAIREAAGRLLQAGHISDVLASSYSRIIVDEYQDCATSQHIIVTWAAEVLPTCVLGDPMQAIFGFGGTQLVDWTTDVLRYFPPVCELQTPWRWQRAGTEALGHWLLTSRQTLQMGGALDLRSAPTELSWMELNPATSDQQRMAAARINAPHRDGTVLVIGDSVNAQGRRQVASQTPGATNVEPVDLRDLTEFSRTFDARAPNALERLVTFAGSLMTNVGAADLLRRVNSLRQGTARIAPTPCEAAAVEFTTMPSLANAMAVLRRIVEQANVRVYRPDMLRSCLSALQAASDGNCTFLEAAIREREKNRYVGRPLSRRAVGSTLLLKGLEADVAVVLHPESMDARHLYVALTRGAQRVVVCSQSPVLTPL
ncbi:UvrD-helicase domain-containing protein [Oxalobacteraceae bacterium R-40]|uniref:UvrD-helicase domain-containing protein n=1 Tax=Keguizhuia sedimenti TaxID=3064264 RepID=A0ABU1BS63_9BURK|nr:UvrD-helicase domain-containing protein [Oxalobacteraceae bacterium R-40]